MTFASRSVFFSVLCLSLMSLCCSESKNAQSESKNAQIDRKLLDFSVRIAEHNVKIECSKKNLSEADCNKLRDTEIKSARKEVQEIIKREDEDCKKSVLLEDECVERKKKMLELVFDKGKEYGL